MNGNGTQDAVLQAIRNGYETVDAICARLDLGPLQVRNAIKRLCDSGDIRRKDWGGYKPMVKRCLLEEMWK